MKKGVIGGVSDRSGNPLPGRYGYGHLAVFLAGAAGMGAEIAAGRQAAVWFGSSALVWGTVIGVILAALSLGYVAGGRLSAGRSGPGMIGGALLGAASLFTVSSIAGEPVFAWTASAVGGTSAGVLLSVSVLYGLPAVLLGAVSPVAVEGIDSGSSGRAAGDIYGSGTAGSIAGVFLTTFLLMPALGLQQLLLFFSGVLVVASALVVSRIRPLQSFGMAAGALLVLGSLGAMAGPAGSTSVNGHEVIFQKQSPYQQVTVTEGEDRRFLVTNGDIMNRVEASEPHEPVNVYEHIFHTSLLFDREVDTVLFVGGGGFNGPRQFRSSYNVTVDVAELDPAVVHAARNYLGVEESRDMRIHTVDGREYLRETDEKYDLIVMDAYRDMELPAQLATREFMSLAKSRLSEDGKLLYYRFGEPDSKLQKSLTKTSESVFPDTVLLGGYPLNRSQNFAMIGMKSEAPAQDRVLEAAAENRTPFNLTEYVRHYDRSPPTDGGLLLRDGHAPMETLSNDLFYGGIGG